VAALAPPIWRPQLKTTTDGFSGAKKSSKALSVMKKAPYIDHTD
jgi:hypothetical protein